MADSSLDDFFAKKDKSKKKNKRFGANNQALNSSEDGSKSDKASKRDKDNANSSSIILSQNDEEWHEYDEKEKDYSGLKIQSLQISEKEKEDSEKECEQELDEDGEPIKTKDGPAGPWKIVSAPVPEPAQPEVIEDKDEPNTQNIVSGGKYVPPHERMGASRLDRVPMKKTRLPKVAPKIDCQSDFPSLSSAVESSVKTDSNADNTSFEQVKNKTRGREDMNNRSSGPKLDLGNKYNALDSDNL